MKQAISQESLSDPGHSYSPQESESTTAASKVKSAAMLGIALSVGASGALVSGAEASATVSAPTPSETTKAFSSSSKTSAIETRPAIAATQRAEVVAYHTVESGESLWQIAQQHRVGLRDLKFANELPPETAIKVGQVLRVPSDSTSVQLDSHVVVAEYETVSTGTAVVTEPALLAQAAEALENTEEAGVIEFVEQDSSATAEESAQEGIIQISEFEVTEQPAVIADASPPVAETAPVVTALATPQAFNNYQIQAGDTLASIASSLGTTTQEIVNANGLANPNVIITGTTLRVPTREEQSVAKADSRPNMPAPVRISGSASDRLTYLRSTATRPESARILGELRSATPDGPASVGGEEVTERDIIGTEDTGSTVASTQSADPFVANMMEDVEAVRDAAVSVSEVAQTESIRSNERPSLLARSANRSVRESGSAEASIAPTIEIDSSELLAAAPISPDAYIPAQRPSAGQVVSPDMPILPEAGEFLPEAPAYFDGYVWPTQGTVTSGYGWRWGRMHRGVDVAGPVGTPVVAAAMGVVEQAGWNSGGYGNLVEIRHPDGSLTRYAHNNRLNVSAGQTVRQGQQIAEMGSTGYSTGPHLHFEVHMSGQGAVNPVAYLPSR